ncbi:conserved protein of unknown function [Ruminococcaceae bacterium BL-6]|nr:conserved protein of unknown function [Ruminococcaceae bacterium BL-6]
MRAKTIPWKTNEPNGSAGKMEGFRLKLTRTKKIAAAVAAVAVIGGMAVGSTLAYLTDQKEATNTITVGDVKIELLEPGFPTGSPPSMEPGMKQAKDPYLENTGSNPAYVRLRVDIPTATIGRQENTPLFELGYLDKDGNFQTNIETLTGAVDGTTVKWVKDGEYYYLRKADGSDFQLPAKKDTDMKFPETPKLFTHIRLNPGLKEEELAPVSGKDYALTEIEVTGEAIQTGGFADAKKAWDAFDKQNQSK